MEFKDKTVWVTGASSGLGEALALAFAEAGAKLILSARNREALERVARDCLQRGAPEAHTLPLDLEKHAELPSKVEQALQLTGGVDILVNNGGVSQRSLAAETDFSVDRRLIDINLLGTIALSKALLPHFLERRAGTYIVVSSLMGKFATPLRSSYAAAKHGLHGFFDALRLEVEPRGIQVTLVCPGFVRTNISINAMTGKGTKQGTMDPGTEKGMPPETVARRILQATARGKREVLIGGKEIFAVYLKRFAPALLHRILLRTKVT